MKTLLPITMRAIRVSAALAAAAVWSASAVAQAMTLPPGAVVATTDDAVLLTVSLKHDQSRPLDETYFDGFLRVGMRCDARTIRT
ncbi:hypothetical protein ACV229_10285 [Burkholderia sp. MR1-5-21]